jgi:putative cell wall-binding protein
MRRRSSGFVLMLVAAASVGAVPRPEVPTAVPAVLAYAQHQPDSSVELHLVRSDGTDDRTLTTGESDVGAVWSPRGDALAFTRLGDRGDLSLVPVPGGEVRTLADGAFEVAVSPDGTRAVYTRSDPEAPNLGLWVVDVDGGEPRALPGTEAATTSVFAPTGDALAYVAANGEGLFVVDLDGGPPRRVTPDDLRLSTGADWSPDGSRLAFAGRQGDGADVLWTVGPDGSGLTRFLSEPESLLSEFFPSGPVWASDGIRLAVSARQDEQDFDVHIVTIPPGGPNALETIQGPGDEALPSWSADGTQLALTRFEAALSDQSDSDVVVVDTVDGGERQVTSSGSALAPTFGPGYTWQLGGGSRIATAVTLSRSTFASADTVVLARADGYADALAGSPLAAELGAPILLTSADRLADAAAEEIDRLGATRVVLLGGEAALSSDVAAQAAARPGVTAVDRVSGHNRFATAAAVAERVTAAAAETSTVYIVEGLDPDPSRGWPDAVSVAGLAGFEGRAVLLVTTEELPDDTVAAIRGIGARRAVVVGGPQAVSDGVLAELGALGLEVERVAGNDRYETSVAVAQRSVAAGMSASRTLVATGLDFPDALAAGPVAATVGGPVVLAAGTDLGATPAVTAYIERNAGRFERIRLIGGPAVLTPRFRVELERAAAPLP